MEGIGAESELDVEYFGAEGVVEETEEEMGAKDFPESDADASRLTTFIEFVEALAFEEGEAVLAKVGFFAACDFDVLFDTGGGAFGSSAAANARSDILNG